MDKERLAVQCTSNGLASGNTAIEATLHALYEVIERDATASARSVASGGENEVDVGTIVGSGANLIEMFLKAGIASESGTRLQRSGFHLFVVRSRE